MKSRQTSTKILKIKGKIVKIRKKPQKHTKEEKQKRQQLYKGTTILQTQNNLQKMLQNPQKKSTI